MPQAQYCRAVGDDRDQIATGGKFARAARIRGDFFADGGDTGGVRQRQIALRGKRLGWRDFDLSRLRKLVIVERVLFQVVMHCDSNSMGCARTVCWWAESVIGIGGGNVHRGQSKGNRSFGFSAKIV